MPPPTISIRSAAKKKLVDILTPVFAALDPPVATYYGWPGHEAEDDEIYVVGPAPGTGTVGYPVMMAGRKQRDDNFVLSVVLTAVVVDDPHAADVRAESFYAVLEDTLANDQTLNELPGVLEALLGPAVSGPDGEALKGGARSTIVADVSVKSRLH